MIVASTADKWGTKMVSRELGEDGQLSSRPNEQVVHATEGSDGASTEAMVNPEILAVELTRPIEGGLAAPTDPQPAAAVVRG